MNFYRVSDGQIVEERPIRSSGVLAANRRFAEVGALTFALLVGQLANKGMRAHRWRIISSDLGNKRVVTV